MFSTLHLQLSSHVKVEMKDTGKQKKTKQTRTSSHRVPIPSALEQHVPALFLVFPVFDPGR